MLNNRFSCLNWSLPLQDVGTICVQLPGLAALNLSNNLMAHDITGLPLLMNLRVLVLNNTGIKWKEVSHFFYYFYSSSSSSSPPILP